MFSEPPSAPAAVGRSKLLLGKWLITDRYALNPAIGLGGRLGRFFNRGSCAGRSVYTGRLNGDPSRFREHFKDHGLIEILGELYKECSTEARPLLPTMVVSQSKCPSICWATVELYAYPATRLAW